MNKLDLTKRLARATHSSRAEAADYLDHAVLSILKQLKHGATAPWPGLGVITKDPSAKIPAPKIAKVPR